MTKNALAIFKHIVCALHVYFFIDDNKFKINKEKPSINRIFNVNSLIFLTHSSRGKKWKLMKPARSLLCYLLNAFDIVTCAVYIIDIGRQ
jgi:hypothetical protein